MSSMCRFVFFPLWIFHAVVARGRFSLPAPSVPHNRHVCHYVSLQFWISFLEWFLLTLWPRAFEINDQDLQGVPLKFLFLGQWAPCHAIVATPLLVAFELLLCIYLESVYGKQLMPCYCFLTIGNWQLVLMLSSYFVYFYFHAWGIYLGFYLLTTVELIHNQGVSDYPHISFIPFDWFIVLEGFNFCHNGSTLSS